MAIPAVNIFIGKYRNSGFTLIELMVAMVLGILVAGGIVTIFISTSSSTKAQTQLARLQEEGRYAIARLSNDLSMANGQYCTNTGGVALAGSGGLYLDHIRAPMVFAKSLIGANGANSGAFNDLSTAWGTTSGAATYPGTPAAAYSMPSFLYMRGYDCTLTACTSVDPTVAGLPIMGKNLGNRVLGTDVITVRYVNPSSGWSIGAAGGSTVATSSTSATISSITLKPLSGEPPASHFLNGDLVMLASCSSSQIFAATYGAGVLTVAAAGASNFTGSGPVSQPTDTSPTMVFDVNQDFLTVTYYVALVSENNDGSAPFTGALIRRVTGGLANAAKGGTEDELVRGIERMDFKYGVQDATGSTSFLTAAQIDASTSCPPAELTAITTTSCLWRGINSIEVSVLMDGQVPLYTLGVNDMNYSYSGDNLNTPTAPGSHPVSPVSQGFVNQMLRREFNALVAVRNYNP